jgi:hypothetical protein
VLFWDVRAQQFEIRPLTSRQRAHIEEQRMRDVSAAIARLEKALDNMMRPAWGRGTAGSRGIDDGGQPAG